MMHDIGFVLCAREEQADRQIGRQAEQFLLGNRSFSFSLLPARQCSDYLANIDERTRLPNYHFIT